MSSYKVDYSELVTALQQHKHGRANALIRELLPRLATYLCVTMEASDEEAEEAVHRAFLRVYKRIMEGGINEKKYIFKYVLEACRHEYLHMAQRKVRVVRDVPRSEDEITPPNQIENLLDKDRQRILAFCLRQLPEKARAYISFIIKHPRMDTKSLSTHFDITEANVRVRKSRIMSDLTHCVKKKWEE